MIGTGPTLALSLIARDEEKTLPTLLASIEGAFDQLVLVDTGSKDRSVEIVSEWAARQPGLELVLAEFEWCHDFAKARNFADMLTSTDWVVWADCDDEIRGAQSLRHLAAQAPAELDGYIMGYDYAQDAHGNCACYLKRERLMRRRPNRWGGRVHEAQAIEGPVQDVPPEICEWVHRKPPAGVDSNKRNLKILRSWVKDEPENPRVLAYLGTEELVRGRAKQAVSFFRRYLKLKTDWDEERAQVHRKLGLALVALGRNEEAIDTALEALRLLPAWPDSYLTLAEAHYNAHEPHKALEWAREAIRRGAPRDTMLIVNPLDYTFLPRSILAGALGAIGALEDAVAAAEDALAIVPDHPGLRQGHATWSRQITREATAQTWIGAAQKLVQGDEQLKALRLLEDTVPHEITDHPGVVAMRSQLRERIGGLFDPQGYAEHYRTGGSKPEDGVPTDAIDTVCGRLPRAAFLFEGLLEQLEVAT